MSVFQSINVCAVCSRAERGHGFSWTWGYSFHNYIPPSNEQRKQRLLAELKLQAEHKL